MSKLILENVFFATSWFSGLNDSTLSYFLTYFRTFEFIQNYSNYRTKLELYSVKNSVWFDYI